MSQRAPLTALERRILNRIQKDIPFTTRPWAALAKALKTTEPLLLERIAFLKKKGIIRRISAAFNSRKLSCVSTLVALKTASSNVKAIARKLNSYPEVTHNYQRAGAYNLWFTLVAGDKKRLTQIIRQIEKDRRVSAVLELPAARLFKLEVNFRV